MQNPDRRQFLKASAGAALLAAPAFSATRLSPNDRLRVGIIGLRGRGRDHIRAWHELANENVEIAAFCDVDAGVLQERASGYEKLSGKKVPALGDMRRILDDKSIHAVSIATPNHWHALATIRAVQAGKDVYVEKPGSHDYFEGKLIIEAEKRYGRVIAHGTQNRSSPNIVEAIQKLKEGVIGRVYLARGIAYKHRASFGKMTNDPVPAGLDWDQWLGPAPKVAYSRKRQSSPAGNSWHLMWDYGNGEIGNQGVHELDIMRWGLGLDEHPTKVSCSGGKYIYPDDQQDAPQVQAASFEYAGRNLLMTFEVRNGETNTEAGMGAEYPFLDKQNVVGVIFIGTEGFMIIPDYSSYHVFLGKKREKGPSKVGAGDITDLPHFTNFMKAVRSGEKLASGVKDLHYSSALAHFANISYRTGRMLHFDSRTEAFAGDEAATGLLRREYRAPYVV